MAARYPHFPASVPAVPRSVPRPPRHGTPPFPYRYRRLPVRVPLPSPIERGRAVGHADPGRPLMGMAMGDEETTATVRVVGRRARKTTGVSTPRSCARPASGPCEPGRLPRSRVLPGRPCSQVRTRAAVGRRPAIAPWREARRSRRTGQYPPFPTSGRVPPLPRFCASACRSARLASFAHQRRRRAVGGTLRSPLRRRSPWRRLRPSGHAAFLVGDELPAVILRRWGRREARLPRPSPRPVAGSCRCSCTRR